MSIESDLRTLGRLQTDLADLSKKDADQASKVADYTKRMNSASAQAAKASSMSSAQSRLREAERYARDVERAQSQRATIAKSVSQKMNDIARLQKRISETQLQSARTAERDAKSLRNKQEARLRRLEQGRIFADTESEAQSDSIGKSHDVFISHAWEDKDGFVRELAEKCRSAGIDAWYDEQSLKWGDSLRQAIDRGLGEAYFGVVVLSENFFKKEWTNYELDGLLQKESSGRGAVLPIWYKVTKDEVEGFSPSLANRLALNTATVTIDQIVEELGMRVNELKPS